MGIGTPFYFLDFFWNMLAHFHFRSHLQSLINGESHQIKLEQSQRCRPEANWRRRLSSLPPLARYPSPLTPPRPPLCKRSFAIFAKRKDPEVSSPSTCRRAAPVCMEHALVPVPFCRRAFCGAFVCMCARQRRQAEPEVSVEVSNCGIWRAAEWCSP